MSRPKGSKNKKKIEEKEELDDPIAIDDEDDEEQPVVKPYRDEGESIPAANTKKVQAATTSEVWSPKPDMGKESSKEKCECGHQGGSHYGSQHRWCNENNCRCGAWKPK